MKAIPPNEYRLKDHPVYSTPDSYGNSGAFIIPHNRITDYAFFCMISDGEGWEHVSVSLVKNTPRRHKYDSVERCPTWAEMCFIKDQFWHEDEVVMQLHPAKKDHVNMHQYCLHLWKPVAETIPTPSALMVGINLKSYNLK